MCKSFSYWLFIDGRMLTKRYVNKSPVSSMHLLVHGLYPVFLLVLSRVAEQIQIGCTILLTLIYN